MKYIDPQRIQEALKIGKSAKRKDVADLLLKCREKQDRLSLNDVATLLCIQEPDLLEELFETARYVKDTIYGNRVVLFAPMYVTNYCVNQCVYCGFRSDNTELPRKALTMDEVREQTESLLKRGHMRVLLVAGESAPPGYKYVDYLVECIQTIYATQVGPFRIKRVNVNCAPMSTEDFRTLKAAGIGTFQVFQETYHEETYRNVHLKGPKSDPDNRLDSIHRAFEADIDDYGIGVLYGLNDYQFETLALMQHVEHLENTLGVGPHTISVPRIEPAQGVAFASNPPAPVSDDDFKKLVAVLRLAVPYTGMILSTRENSEMRDFLLNLGISQISAESETAPGGYQPVDVCGSAPCENESDLATKFGKQFLTSDDRSLDEMVQVLMDKNYLPSFCAACYRKGRTGEVFMHMAKPGEIKTQCSINAIATLKEYLLDFASPETKERGEAFIQKTLEESEPYNRTKTQELIARIEAGERDVYV